MVHFTGVSQILLISCITLYLFEKVEGDPTATIGRSQIVGQSVYAGEGVVHQYLSIPYAEAPIGPLRFKKPVPRKFLPDFFFAFNNPPACWQQSAYNPPWFDEFPPKNEDCLYLNIWAPEDASPTNKKAVIYFLHGGGYRFGSIKQRLYEGAPLAAHGDVIVVTANYRLESFGFLTSGTEDAPGNVGLYDMLEGLKWVNKNIEAFGGDASRITLAGQGAGSISVGILSTSPLAKGLFQRMIMESGSPLHPDKGSLQHNIDISQKVAERLFCANKTYTIQDNPKEVLSCLRSVGAETLTDVSAAIHPLSSFLYLPQYGDDIAPIDPRDAIKNDNFTCNDILIGNTNDEGSYILTTHFPIVYGFFGVFNPAINKTLGKKEMKKILSKFPDRNAIVKHYLPNYLPNDAALAVRNQVSTSFGDAFVNCPVTFYAEQCAKTGSNVYKYVWNHRPSNSDWAPWMGAVHASELEFVFGVPLVHSFRFQPDEANLSRKIMDIWSSFAKDGKPSIPWQEFSKENPQVKVLGPVSSYLQDQKGFHPDNCNFFRPYFGF